MTFSIAGRCADTGHLGFAVTTSSVCVGARCGKIGADCVVFSQARTDPRLHDVGVAFVDAADAVRAMEAAATGVHWRQLGALGRSGDGAFVTGAACLPDCGGLVGRDCLALGNYLASERVLPAMVDGFQAAGGALSARLIAALVAGAAAGGERDPLQSAALRVMGDDGLVEADLRIDMSRDPLADLGALWANWAPKAAAYRVRALDPDAAPPSSRTEGFTA